MKKLLISLACIFAAVSLSAQQFDYNVGIRYGFINSEYTASHNLFEESRTFNRANLTAEAGIRFDQNKTTHLLRGGLAYGKDLGISLEDQLDKQLLAYYQIDRKTRWGNLSAAMGIFPRTFSEGSYHEAIFSKEHCFTDLAFEGMMLKYREKGFYAEIGLDWFGKYGQSSRERFQILSAGHWKMFDSFYLGWDACLYHFACSEVFKNVVDNMFAHPYIMFSPKTEMQKLSISAGWMQKYDWDRAYPDDKIFHGGFTANVSLKKWNFGLDDNFFFGQDLMPNYIGSNKNKFYKTDLYFGNRFYHTQIDGFSIYNQAEFYYEPSLGDWAKLRISLIAHIGNPTGEFGFFRGWQQLLTVVVDLDSIRRK